MASCTDLQGIGGAQTVSTRIWIEEICEFDAYDGELIGLFAEGNISDEQFLIAAREHLKIYSETILFNGPVIHERIRRKSCRGDEQYQITFNARGRGSEEVTRVKVLFAPKGKALPA
jgi:hypothetical protein